MRALFLLLLIFLPEPSRAQTVSPEKIIEFLLVKRGVPQYKNEALPKLVAEFKKDPTLQALMQEEGSELVSEFESYHDERAVNRLETKAEKYLQALLTHETQTITAQTKRTASELVSLSEALKRSTQGGFADPALANRFYQFAAKKVRADFIAKPETFPSQEMPLLRTYLGLNPLGKNVSAQTWLKLYPFSPANPYLKDALAEVRSQWMNEPVRYQSELSQLVSEGSLALGGDADETEFLRNLYSKTSELPEGVQKRLMTAAKALPLEEKITAEIAFRKKSALPEDLSRSGLYQAAYLKRAEGISDPLNRDLMDWISLQLSHPKKITSVAPFQFHFLQEIDPATATRYQEDYLKKVFVPRLRASGVDPLRNDQLNREIVQRIFNTPDSASKSLLINLELSETPQTRAYEGIRSTVQKELEALPNSRALVLGSLLDAEKAAILKGPSNQIAALKVADTYQNAVMEFAGLSESRSALAEALESHAEFLNSLRPLFENGLQRDTAALVNRYVSFLEFAERTAIQKQLTLSKLKALSSQFQQSIGSERTGLKSAIPGVNCATSFDYLKMMFNAS